MYENVSLKFRQPYLFILCKLCNMSHDQPTIGIVLLPSQHGNGIQELITLQCCVSLEDGGFTLCVRQV